jgi:hypothetical protein
MTKPREKKTIKDQILTRGKSPEEEYDILMSSKSADILH